MIFVAGKSLPRFRPNHRSRICRALANSTINEASFSFAIYRLGIEPTATATEASTPTAQLTETPIVTATATASATAIPTESPAPLYRLDLMRRGTQMGLEELKLRCLGPSPPVSACDHAEQFHASIVMAAGTILWCFGIRAELKREQVRRESPCDKISIVRRRIVVPRVSKTVFLRIL
jgi:hypothetical protein